MKNETSQNLVAIVDKLGLLAAAAADIDMQSKALKAELILAGVESLEGAKYRAAVSHCPGRSTVNWRALAEHLGASPALVEEFTEIGTPYSTVRISARKGV